MTLSRIERGLELPGTLVAERHAQALGIAQRRYNRLLSEARAAAADATPPAPAEHVG